MNITNKIKKLIKEEIKLFQEAKEIVINKGDWEIVYPENSKELWLIPKRGQTSDKVDREMEKFVRWLKGSKGIGVRDIEMDELDSRRVLLKNKIDDVDLLKNY